MWTCQKGRFSTPDLLNQVWGWDPVCFLNKPSRYFLCMLKLEKHCSSINSLLFSSALIAFLDRWNSESPITCFLLLERDWPMFSGLWASHWGGSWSLPRHTGQSLDTPNDWSDLLPGESQTPLTSSLIFPLELQRIWLIPSLIIEHDVHIVSCFPFSNCLLIMYWDLSSWNLWLNNECYIEVLNKLIEYHITM